MEVSPAYLSCNDWSPDAVSEGEPTVLWLVLVGAGSV